MIKIAIILLTSLIPISVELSSLSLKFLKLICRFLICHYSGNLDICPGSVPLSEFYNDIPIVEWFNLHSDPPPDVTIILDLENGTSEFFGGNSFIDYNVFCHMYTRNLHRLQNSSQIMPHLCGNSWPVSHFTQCESDHLPLVYKILHYLGSYNNNTSINNIL